MVMITARLPSTIDFSYMFESRFESLIKLSKIKQRAKRLEEVGRICFATSFLFLFLGMEDLLGELDPSIELILHQSRHGGISRTLKMSSLSKYRTMS
jgi:hypothetical protein